MIQFLHILASNEFYHYFFILTILICVWCYLIMVLVCISLMTIDVEIFFMCLLVGDAFLKLKITNQSFYYESNIYVIENLHEEENNDYL